MLRINQIKIPLKEMEEALRGKGKPESPTGIIMPDRGYYTVKNDKEKELIHKRLIRLLRCDDCLEFSIAKKSIDARKGEVRFIYSVEIPDRELKKIPRLAQKKQQWKRNRDFVWEEEKQAGRGWKEDCPKKDEKEKDCQARNMTADKQGPPPVIVGSGPAGLFCALTLSRAGKNPILIERGKPVEERILKVQNFWDTGVLDTECNVQFGEGGAGTFSDGKLNTMVRDNGFQKRVMETLVKFGAPEEILYFNKPHVGTDQLSIVVKNIREEIKRLGGQVLFDTKLTGLNIEEGASGRKLKGIIVEKNPEKAGRASIKTEIPCETLVLALGHSARDTFTMLRDAGLSMEKKPFAIGVRAEHLQEDIDRAQYGQKRGFCLPAADYKLTAQIGDRSVYSFCMCPGGYVVNASSETGMLAVNGMSYSGRDGRNANSALVVSVTPEDFPGQDVLSGVEFQRKWESLAYKAGNGKIPVQLYGDFCRNRLSNGYGLVNPDNIVSQAKGGTAFANLRGCLPEYVSTSLIEAMKAFGKKIQGFDREDVVFSGVETRTSSPIRILRGEDGQSTGIAGIYPCGEGAGYAGGITSAAMDGIRIGERIVYRPLLLLNTKLKNKS